MKSKIVWILILLIVTVLGALASSIKQDADWLGEYVVGDLGGAAAALDLPVVRGEGQVTWSYEPLDEQRRPCTVALWVDPDDGAVAELFVPHVEQLVATDPEAVHVVWVSTRGDDAWLPADAPGTVVHDASGTSHESYGGRRLPFGVLVDGRAAVQRTGFPTEIDEVAVTRAVAGRRLGRPGGGRRSSSLNTIEPILYRDGDSEKLAVRVIPPDLVNPGNVRTRYSTSLASASYSVSHAAVPEALDYLTSDDLDVSAVPAELNDVVVKVDAWVSGIAIGENSPERIARRAAFDALLEAFDLRATRETGAGGADLLVVIPRD